jgi:hypothetical protein
MFSSLLLIPLILLIETLDLVQFSDSYSVSRSRILRALGWGVCPPMGQSLILERITPFSLFWKHVQSAEAEPVLPDRVEGGAQVAGGSHNFSTPFPWVTGNGWIHGLCWVHGTLLVPRVGSYPARLLV